jgi:hypothetical protein
MRHPDFKVEVRRKHAKPAKIGIRMLPSFVVLPV